MPEDLKLSQIGSSQLPPPFRGIHSPGVRKHCQIIFACYFQKSSTELLVHRKWFGQFKLYFLLNWLVMRCKLLPELAADAQQTA